MRLNKRKLTVQTSPIVIKTQRRRSSEQPNHKVKKVLSGSKVILKFKHGPNNR